MIPGSVSKVAEKTIASTTTISPNTDVTYVTGTEAIATITPPHGAQVGQILILIPDAAFTCVTTGNIALAVTAVAKVPLIIVWNKARGKWYPSYV
jgi:hypothetical protein